MRESLQLLEGVYSPAQYAEESVMVLGIKSTFDHAEISISPSTGSGNTAKRYDYSKSLKFSLNTLECIELKENFKILLSGEYINKISKDAKDKNSLAFIRKFPDGNATKVLFTPINSNPKGLTITIFLKRDNRISKCDHTIRNINQILQFYNFIKKCSEDLDFISAVKHSEYRKINSDSKEESSDFSNEKENEFDDMFSSKESISDSPFDI